MYPTKILILLLAPFCYSTQATYFQKFQNLAIGACADQDPTFCSHQVENSVCNRAKNECFCRNGYVAIKENGKVSCKTLLTDLRCRVDRDCIHVNRSSCHPGAGYCSCPGGTIYVPQQNACRQRLITSKNSICKACHSRRGKCFIHDLHSGSQTVGCVCPEGRTASATTLDRNNQPFDYLCDGRLVDIGEVCDQSTMFCRSQRALCRGLSERVDDLFDEQIEADYWHEDEHQQKMVNLTSSWTSNQRFGQALRFTSSTNDDREIRVCQCPSGSIPVFQSTLGYIECLNQIPSSHPTCLNCSHQGGQCFDTNEDGSSDGCSCPASKSSQESAVKEGKPCSIEHASINCTGGFVSVCYRPHSVGLYRDFEQKLLTGQSLVRIGGPIRSQSSRNCQLERPSNNQLITYSSNNRYMSKHSNRLESSMIFCHQLDVWGGSERCGSRLYMINQDTIRIELLLEVLFDAHLRSPGKDLQIPLVCLFKKPDRARYRQESRAEKYSALKSANIEQGIVDVSLKLRVLSSVNQELSITTVGTSIKLDALLIDTTGNHHSIAVEECFFTNHLTDSADNLTLGRTCFIKNRCPVNGGQHTSITFTSSDLPSNHLQSNLFDAFRVQPNSSSVFFHCRFMLCPNSLSCKKPNCGIDDKRKVQPYELRRPNAIYVDRMAHIEVSEVNNHKFDDPPLPDANYDLESSFQTIHRFRFAEANSDPPSTCRHALCLTTVHLTWLIFSLCLFIILTSLLLILLYRRQSKLSVRQKFPSHKEEEDDHDLGLSCNQSGWMSPGSHSLVKNNVSGRSASGDQCCIYESMVPMTHLASPSVSRQLDGILPSPTYLRLEDRCYRSERVGFPSTRSSNTTIANSPIGTVKGGSIKRLCHLHDNSPSLLMVAEPSDSGTGTSISTSSNIGRPRKDEQLMKKLGSPVESGSLAFQVQDGLVHYPINGEFDFVLQNEFSSKNCLQI